MDKEVVLNDHISVMLGRGFSRSSIISSASLAIMCLFYVYTLGTYLQVKVYPLIDRVTYYTPFNFYIINEYVDHVIIGSLLVLWLVFSIQRSRAGYIAIAALAALFAIAVIVNYDLALDSIALSTLPVMVALLIYSRYSKRILNNDSRLWINYLAIVGIIIGIVSFAFAVSNFATNNVLGYPIERNYAYGVFLLFSSASPILMLLLITSFPVRLFTSYVSARGKPKQYLVPTENQMPATLRIVYLSLFVLMSIAIAIIPHLPTTNIDGKQVGVDTGYYVNWVGTLNNATSFQDFVYEAFAVQGGAGDRPISLIFFYMLNKATGANLSNIVEYAPVIIGPALVIVVYLLTRELTSSDRISLLAAFLTAISFQILIGIYAGFYANWIALAFGYASFVFLFRFLKKGSSENLGIFAGLFILTLFSHTYTWSVLSIAIGTFLAVMLKLNYYSRKNLMMLIVALLGIVAIDLVRASITGSSGGIEDDLSLAERLVGPDQFTLRWNNLTYATTTFVAGIFSNAIILGLGLYWLFRSNMKEPANIFLIIFLSVGILPFLFGEWVIQTRVFYNIPFQMPAAMALFWIRNQTSGGLKTLPIYIWLITIAIIAVSNFYLILPDTTPNS